MEYVCMVCNETFTRTNQSQKVCVACQQAAKDQGYESYRYCRKHRMIGLVKHQKTLCPGCISENTTHCVVCGQLIQKDAPSQAKTCSSKCNIAYGDSRRRATNIKRYGAEVPWASAKVCATRDANNKAKYGVSNVSHLDWVQEKISAALTGRNDMASKRQATCIQKYGVPYPSQVSWIREKAEANSKHAKQHVDIYGNSWNLLGTEPLTLQWLYDHRFVNIRNTQRPTIKYEFEGRTRHYWCDFIIDEDIIVESKSWWTWQKEEDQNIEKIKACLAMGYFVLLLIWDSKKQPTVFLWDSPFSPLIVTNTSRTAGDIQQSINSNTNTTTVTRQL